MPEQSQRRVMFLLLLLSGIFLSTACAFITNKVQTLLPAPTHTSTPEASVTPSSSQATGTPPGQSQVPIVYYYFVAIESNTYPAGSVVILPDALILGPTLSPYARSSDPVTNIRSALQAMLNDPRNAWNSSQVGITSIIYQEGAANVVLDGEYFAGGGDIVLIAARTQIFLTVFAEPAVQTATITLNGENIANLGVSHSSQAKPVDYAYTRAEIDTFLEENAYPAPASP